MRPTEKGGAMRLLRRCGTVALLCAAYPFLTAAPSNADLRVCNKTTSRVGIAIGYKADRDWTTEGWWTVDSDSCATILAGPLIGRFYYMYAVDYDQGGEWGGDSAFLCTQEKEFTIEGVSDCVARGYQKTGFYEVDTGNQESWTIQLTEPTSRGVGGR
jgi:uncharacterized membrane protein